MADLNPKARYSVDVKQGEMFRLAERDYGLTIAELKRKSGISTSTLTGWKNGSAMPAWALGALCEAGLPDELATLTLEPFGRFVASADETEGDLDALATMCSDFLAEYSRSRHPNSPGGIHIVHTEKEVLTTLRRGLQAHARRQAAA